MTVGLVMMVKNEAKWVQPTLLAVKPLVDSWTVVDTGSTDHTREIIAETMEDIPGRLVDREWTNFSDGWNHALGIAKDSADWLLRLDADWRVDYTPSFRPWLDDDTCPEVDAWNVELFDSGTRWRLPVLMRGNQPWQYKGACHEYLDTAGRNVRSLLGFQITHVRPGGSDPNRFQTYIELLRDDCERNEPRAVFYTAESLRFLGLTDAAIHMYRRRAILHDGFEEERWFAQYQAARLSGDKEGLIAAWRQRPQRHEPLAELARIVYQEGAPNDVLFKQELTL